MEDTTLVEDKETKWCNLTKKIQSYSTPTEIISSQTSSDSQVIVIMGNTRGLLEYNYLQVAHHCANMYLNLSITYMYVVSGKYLFF